MVAHRVVDIATGSQAIPVSLPDPVKAPPPSPLCAALWDAPDDLRPDQDGKRVICSAGFQPASVSSCRNQDGKRVICSAGFQPASLSSCRNLGLRPIARVVWHDRSRSSPVRRGRRDFGNRRVTGAARSGPVRGTDSCLRLPGSRRRKCNHTPARRQVGCMRCLEPTNRGSRRLPASKPAILRDHSC